MNQEKIGKFIAELRKEKNLTQEELANKLHITKNAVSKWERGLSMMDMSLLIPVCDILEISITELLNGERVESEKIKEQTDNAIKNTLKYSNEKIKKSRIKSIIFTTILIVVLSFGLFFGYKLFLLHKYTLKRPDSVDKVIAGLKNSKDVKIYKRTLPEDEYLTLDNFKIRNVLDGYELDRKHDDQDAPSKYYIYRKKEGDKTTTIQFNIVEKEFQLNEAFASDLDFYGDGDSSMNPKAFNSADRKFFLLKNDINNEIDFYKYVADHYYVENNIFMDRRTMMENYAFNLFASIAIPEVKGVTYIKGDYEGAIFEIGTDDNNVKIYSVGIMRDGREYGFVSNDPRFGNIDYLIDLIGTIEIR